MGVPVNEQETSINFSRDGKYASIWTSDSTVMTKLDKRVESGDYELIDVGKDRDGNILSKEYQCPKRLVSFRSKKVTRELTEEQKQAVSERMKAILNRKKRDGEDVNSQNQF